MASILGIGVLGLPAALSSMKTSTAVALILISSVANALIGLLLSWLSEESPEECLENHIYGILRKVAKELAYTASLGAWVYAFGASISYIILATSSIKDLLGINWYLIWLVYTSLIAITSLMWRRNPKAVGSLTTVTTILSITLLLIGMALVPSIVTSSFNDHVIIGAGGDPRRALAVVEFSIFGHISILSIKSRYKGKIEGVIWTSWLLIGLLYTLIYVICPKTSNLINQAFSSSSIVGLIFRSYAITASTGAFISYTSSTWDNFRNIFGEKSPLINRDRRDLLSFAVTFLPPSLISLVGVDVVGVLALAGSFGAGIVLLAISLAGVVKFKREKKFLSMGLVLFSVAVILSFIISLGGP